MRVPQSSSPSIALLILGLSDGDLRIPFTSARKGVTEDDIDDEAYSVWAPNTRQTKGEHVAKPEDGGHSSTVEGGRDRDQDSAADVTRAISSGVDETSHADTGSRLHDRSDSDCSVASASLSVKRKLPLATGRSVKSNSAPQHDRKRRRHPFSAPMPSDELDTGDETSGSVYVPRESPRGRGPSQPSHLPRQVHHLKMPHRECARSEFIGHQGSPLKSSPSSSRVAPPVANTVVVFEQQQWKGKIIDERHVSRERGRPRKQYRICWAPSWVDSARLAAPKLIEDWEEKGRKDMEGSW